MGDPMHLPNFRSLRSVCFRTFRRNRPRELHGNKLQHKLKQRVQLHRAVQKTLNSAQTQFRIIRILMSDGITGHTKFFPFLNRGYRPQAFESVQLLDERRT